ncbi:MAG: hypothetical protein QOD07_2837 [Frankiaceae bacterium]|jgi:hypothetical protein|nr:hypothetical protein [Frankiaceae bacterium]
MDHDRPSIFIGSSAEGKPLAEQLQLNLGDKFRTQIWSQGVFRVGSDNLRSLVDASHKFDFAVLVLTPDDVIERHGHIGQSPTDNVIFEAGLFVGALGPDRTFLVLCRDDAPVMPSDLDGVVSAAYDRPGPNDDLQAVMGPPATRIKNAIQQVLAKSASPSYLRAFAALAGELTREELIRVITEIEKRPQATSQDDQVLLQQLKREFETRGYDEDTQLTREDLSQEIRKYKRYRELMPGGAERTGELEGVLGEVTHKAERQTYTKGLVEQLLAGDEGDRIVGITLARVRPERDNFSGIRSAIVEPRSNFEHAHAIETMTVMAKLLKPEQRRDAQQVVDTLLEDRDALIVEGDPSRLVLVEKLAAVLSRLG